MEEKKETLEKDVQLTSSESINKLIVSALAVLNKEGSLDELKDCVAKKKESLLKAKDEFSTQNITIDKETGEEIINVLYKEEVENILADLERQEQALELIEDYLIDENPDNIKSAIEILKKTTEKITKNLEIYNNKILHSGITPFPYINALIRFAEAVKLRTATKENFADYFTVNFNDFIEFLRQDLAAHKAIKDIEKENQQIESYLDKLIQAGEKINSYIKTDEKQKLEEGLKEIIETANEIHKLMEKAADKMLADGPTRFPNLNMLITIGQEVIEGKASPEIFSSIVDNVDTEMQKIRLELENIQTELEEEEAKEELEGLLEDFNLTEDGIDELRTYFKDKNPEHITLGLKILEKSVTAIDDFHKKIKPEEPEEPTKFCIKCKHVNPIEIEYCEECGNRLPNVFAEPSNIDLSVDEEGEIKALEEEYLMTSNIQMTLKAVENVGQQKITMEEFEAVLDQMEQNARDGEQDRDEFVDTMTKEPFASEEEKKIYEEMMLILDQGIKEFKEGLSILRIYTTDQSPSYLEKGLETFLEGSKKIHQFYLIMQAFAESALPKTEETTEEDNLLEVVDI